MRVTAINIAGIESAFSETVSIKPISDTTPPWINAVSPNDLSPIGINAEICVQATDYIGLASIGAQYHNGTDWVIIGENPVSGYSVITLFTWDNAALTAGITGLRVHKGTVLRPCIINVPYSRNF